MFYSCVIYLFIYPMHLLKVSFSGRHLVAMLDIELFKKFVVLLQDWASINFVSEQELEESLSRTNTLPLDGQSPRGLRADQIELVSLGRRGPQILILDAELAHLVGLGAGTLDVDYGSIELVIDVLTHGAEYLSGLRGLQSALDKPGCVSWYQLLCLLHVNCQVAKGYVHLLFLLLLGECLVEGSWDN